MKASEIIKVFQKVIDGYDVDQLTLEEALTEAIEYIRTVQNISTSLFLHNLD